MAPLVGSVFVVGGCGFFGYHLVHHLLQDDECGGPIHVLDCNVDKNRHADVVYTAGNITDVAMVDQLVKSARPSVIFHVASPPAALPASRKQEFYDTNVNGTEILLTIAAECDSVEAFVYCSTVDAYADPPHDNVDETHALWGPSARTNEYNRTKAIADRLVLAASGPRLRTVSLRPGHMYGERHTQGLVEALEACSGNSPLFQVGDGKNMMEVASGGNVAAAHILAAKALLAPSRATGKVDGEAFNVSDGSPVPFWHHIKIIQRVARGEAAVEKVTVIPASAMAAVVFLTGWAFWIFTFGTVEPPATLSQSAFDYCTGTHTYSIQKAQQRLGYRPIELDHDAVLEQSVRWELNRRKTKAELNNS